MKGRVHIFVQGSCLLSAIAFTACSDPSAPSNTPVQIEIEGEEICPAHDNWLPEAPEYSNDPATFFKPAAHPDSECPFYSLAWQNFLYATQPLDADANPRITTYPVIDDIFTPIEPLPAGALNKAGEPRGNASRSWLGLIEQAGFRDVAIDENGRTLYYGIHVNQAFADFIDQQGLKTAYAIQNAPKDLILPPGLVEFKSAWEQIDDTPDQTTNWVTTKAWVPHLSVDKSAGSDPSQWKMVEDHNKPTQITVRLLALHVVVTFPGHAEFFWGHLEHTDVDMKDPNQHDWKAENGYRSLAPITVRRDADGVLLNPDDTDNVNITDPVSVEGTNIVGKTYVLYQPGAPTNSSNKGINAVAQYFDEGQQKFLNNGAPMRTSIYRMFPASKSNTTDPDPAISSLNHNVEALFRKYAGQLQPNDYRGNYRLVGGQWMDKPAFFTLNSRVQNDPKDPTAILLDGTVHADAQVTQQAVLPGDATQAADRAAVLEGLSGEAAVAAAQADIIANGSDSAFSILAGEDRMSGMPLESFTQTRAQFPNCFTCHNTKAIASHGVPYNDATNGNILMPPKLLNVSHVFSEFVRDECDKPPYNTKKVSDTDPNTVFGQDLHNSAFGIALDAPVALCPPPAAAPAGGTGSGQ